LAWCLNASTPSFSEIELTMPLPWMHLRPGLDHLPLRAVDHDRHARDLGLGRDEVQEAHHRGLAVEHGLVHVDVDDLRAVLDLLARDRQRLLELAVEDRGARRPSSR
jgi:hypothetical protein